MVALVQHLNSDPKVHAILLQLPLDSENPIDADKCTNTIAVYKVNIIVCMPPLVLYIQGFIQKKILGGEVGVAVSRTVTPPPN